MNVLSDFIIRVENNTTFDNEGFEGLKEAASTFSKKAGTYAKDQAKKASTKVKETVDKGKDMSFDDLKEMSNVKIKQLLKELDVEQVAIALKDAEKDLTEKVIPNMTKTAKKQYDDLQKELKKVKKTDIKKYRMAVEDKLKDMFGK